MFTLILMPKIPRDVRDPPVIKKPRLINMMPRLWKVRAETCRDDDTKQEAYEVIDTLLANVGGMEDLMRIARLIRIVGVDEFEEIVSEREESKELR